jgi:colicin import membrane protein
MSIRRSRNDPPPERLRRSPSRGHRQRPGKARSAAVAWLLTALMCSGVALADDDAAERQRIERERAEIIARSRTDEAACAQRFAVSACVEQVRGERRAALHQLDLQRALLDDAQRKRRAAERQERIRLRQDTQSRDDESRQSPAASAASAPARAASAAEPEAARRPEARRRSAAAVAEERDAAAKRAAASKRRAEEAAAHRAAVEQRNMERNLKKPPAPTLPVPAASAASASTR